MPPCSPNFSRTSSSGVSGVTEMAPLLMMSVTSRVSGALPSVEARATSRSVRTPTGTPPSTTGTAAQSASRKIITASRTELKGEQVRGLAVITSPAVRVDRVGSLIGGSSGQIEGARFMQIQMILEILSHHN